MSKLSEIPAIKINLRDNHVFKLTTTKEGLKWGLEMSLMLRQDAFAKELIIKYKFLMKEREFQTKVKSLACQYECLTFLLHVYRKYTKERQKRYYYEEPFRDAYFGDITRSRLKPGILCK